MKGESSSCQIDYRELSRLDECIMNNFIFQGESNKELSMKEKISKGLTEKNNGKLSKARLRNSIAAILGIPNKLKSVNIVTKLFHQQTEILPTQSNRYITQGEELNLSLEITNISEKKLFVKVWFEGLPPTKGRIPILPKATHRIDLNLYDLETEIFIYSAFTIIEPKFYDGTFEIISLMIESTD